MSLKAVIETARQKGYALGHFNVSTIEVVWAIVEAAMDSELPVVIGVSEGERAFIGIHQIAALVKSIKTSTGHPIFLNADHTYTIEGIQAVLEADFDSVIFDGAKLSLEDNITQTKQVVDLVRSQKPEVLVEAEVGYIGTSSSLLDNVPQDVNISPDAMPTPQDIKRFVSQTGVDLIAPAVGNIHGMLKSASNPNLQIDLIRQVAETVDTPMVLHGGSGISDDQFVEAIEAGIAMVHLNTELRVAWKNAVSHELSEHPDQVAPYKLLTPAKAAVKEVVQSRLHLFARH